MERGEFNIGLPEDLVEKMRSLGDVEPTEVEGEVACKTLPDELVERLIAMVPFPTIFKARCLSKLWLARLSSISSDDDDASKFSAASTFQRQVSERSGNWVTFCSVSKSTLGDYFGFDRTSQTWRRMPSLSFLQPRLRGPSRKYLQIEGPLVCLFRNGRELREIYVANILTQSWNLLQPPPLTAAERRNSLKYRKLVVDKSSDTYMVILLCSSREQNDLSVHIYDSKSESWTSNSFDADSFSYYPSTAALLNGVLYMFGFSGSDYPYELLAYNFVSDFESSSLSLQACGFTGGVNVISNFHRKLSVSQSPIFAGCSILDNQIFYLERSSTTNALGSIVQDKRIGRDDERE